MNKMKKSTASAAVAGATPRSEPSPSTQLVQAEPQQLELLSTHSHELIIANLRKLSEALFAFQQCLSDLQQHIGSVRTSIDSSMLLLLIPPPHTTKTAPPSVTLPTPEPVPEPEPSCESDPSEVENEEEDEVVEEEEEEEEDGVEEEEEELKSPSRSELEMLCETMNIVGLKKYMITHLSDITELREQLPKALKLSPNPARLVLDCINKGTKKRVNSLRLASLLALECFLLMMGEAKDEGVVVEIEKGVKEEAEQAALAWRARMIAEGGVSKAHKMVARGLLLLIGSFGIPEGFLDRDIRYLVKVSGASGITGALRRSSVLMERIPKIIEWMLTNNIIVGAVDIAYTFGMEDRFNPRRILTSFLHNSEVSYLNKLKGLEQGIAVRAGKKNYLSDLISVSECLGRHKIDPSKLLPGWQIDVRIMNLEKEIAGLNMHIGEKELAELTRHIGDHKMAQKRKIDETESSGSFSNKEMKPSQFSNPNPWPPQQQRVVNHVDDSNNTLLERGGTAGHIYGYSLSPSLLHGTVAGSINENVVGSLAGPVGGVVAMNGAEAGKSVKGGSCVGVHGGILVDHTHGQIGSHTGQLYGPRGDAAVQDRLASHTYAYRPSSYLEGSGSKVLPSTIPGGAYRPSPYLEGSTGLPNTTPADAYRPTPYMQSSKGLRNNMSGDANQPPPYMEGAAGLPNIIAGDAYRPPPYSEGSTGLANNIPAPYQFADIVPATELYRSAGS